MIEIQNLYKSYGTHLVLEDFSLTIPAASVYGLCGINGAGKSTLLRVLAGVLRQEKGEVFYDGNRFFDSEKVKKDVFFIPDEPFYTVQTTGKSILDLYKCFYNVDKDLFFYLVRLYDLSPTVPLRKFSKGMRRRLFTAIALAANPRFLLLDEVFDGLDPRARLLFKQILQEWKKRTDGICLIASHSLRELQDIADGFAFIDGKRLSSSGSLADALSSLFKFQVAFRKPMLSEQDLGLLCESFETSGQICRFVVRGEKDFILNKINSLNPFAVEELNVDFEEYFLSQIKLTGEANPYV